MIKGSAKYAMPVGLLLAAFFFGSTDSQAAFTAYNDTAWTADTNGFIPLGDPVVGVFSTNSPWGKTSGSLIGTNGAILPVQVTFSGSNSFMQRLDRIMGPPAGSDAEAAFFGKIGTNCTANWGGGTVTMTLSAMNPTVRYDVTIWSARGANTAQYSNRFTDIVISGADLFTNSSSAGTPTFTNSVPNDGTRARAAWNDRVTRYTGINPGSDGQITFSMTAGADAIWPTNNPYGTNGYINAFMVTEYPPTPTPPAITNTGATIQSGTSTILYGNLTSTGNVPTQVWVFWKAGVDGGTVKDNWTFSSAFGTRAAGSVSLLVTNLQPNTTYYYRFYASNSVGESWATPATYFTTPGSVTLSSAGSVVINEIMYDPFIAWPTNSPVPVDGDTSYIELFNSWTGTVNITGYHFDNGVSFDFPSGTKIGPGGYLVVCGDLAAFQNRYPGVTNCIGNFSGGLSSDGETLTLSLDSVGINNNAITIDEIQYVGSGNSQGGGPSLELINPGFASLNEQYYGDWVDSASTNGTPGSVNSQYASTPLPVVGDVKQIPPLPPPNSSVFITARGKDYSTNRLGSMILQYRRDSTPTQAWVSVGMADDGTGGDEFSNDGKWSAYLPPYGQTGFPSGAVLEFKIVATDSLGHSRTNPAYSSMGVTSTPLSYLCMFMQDTYSDCAYASEYETHYILMTAANTNYLDTRGGTDLVAAAFSDDPVDGTLVTSDGDVYYNCGIRFRGGSTRIATNYPVKPYRINLPAGRDYKGETELDFNSDHALQQYIGFSVFNAAGKGIPEYDISLARLWLNGELVSQKANQPIYIRFEKFGNSMLKNHGNNDDPFGNIYKADGDSYQGDFSYSNNITHFTVGDQSATASGAGYVIVTNNPYTAWSSLSNLCWYLNQAPSALPSITNRIDVREWARIYAAALCLNNDEAGVLSPGWTYGDELRLYAGENDHKFVLIPWDLSDIILNSTTNFYSPWAWEKSHTTSQMTISNLLFHAPILPYYAGDCIDIMNTIMSSNSMSELFVEMGSKVNPYRTQFQAAIAGQKANIAAAINTNLTVRGNGVTYVGAPLIVTNVSNIQLSGLAPQNYATQLRVNGFTNNVVWNPAFTNWLTTGTNWITPNPVGLSNYYNEILVESLDVKSNVLASQLVKVLFRPTTVNTSGTISINTTWTNGNGAVTLTNNVTLSSGATLTIAPGTFLSQKNGSRLIVGANCKVDYQGTATSPIFLFAENTGQVWSVEASSSGAIVTGRYVRAQSGSFSASNGGRIALDNCSFSSFWGTNGILNSASGGNINLTTCLVDGFSRIMVAGGSLALTQTKLTHMTDAGVNMNAGSLTMNRSTISASVGSNPADGVRLTGNAVAGITNSWLHDLSNACVRAVDAAETVRIVGTLLNDSAKGVEGWNVATCTNQNCTIADCGVGLVGQQTAINCILWNNDAWSSNATLSVSYSDIEQSGNALVTGASNMNRKPFFWASKDDDYRLLGTSPCKGAGNDGSDLGALFACGATPQAPTNLVIGTIGSTSIQMTWMDNSTDERSFDVHRSDDGGDSWHLVTNLVAGTTTYTNNGLTPGSDYSYRVRAAHDRDVSLYSEARTGTTMTGQTAQDLVNGLRITEVMYHPTGSGEAEFIELKNVGGIQLNLSGVYFDDNRYIFPQGTTLNAGAFFLLVRDATAFTNVYPGRAFQAVYTNGVGLANAGETLWVKDSNGVELINFTYDDNAPWPEGADALGYSLVLMNEATGAPYDVSRWRASVNSGGSPGQDDPATSLGTVLINEVLPHQDTDNPGDWIELYNPGSSPVNISYWFLSDDPLVLTNYRIPNGTTISAGGYLAFNEFSNFGTNVLGRTNGFALSEWGETLYLSSGNSTGQLTSYRTSASFGAAERDVTMGRIIRSDGQIDFEALASPTLNATNSSAKVGPVVINEIMYHPDSDGNEFVEIYNNSASGVALSDGTNTWKFDGAMEYQFPPGTVLAQGGYALIVSIDPDDFRSTYGVTNPAIQVFGPFSGNLNNEGESVELYKPGEPETNGYIPFILVEKIEYTDIAPWPSLADGQGPALERKDAWVYGNDPTNWVAVSIGGTPGRGNNTGGLPAASFKNPDGESYESNTTVTVGVTLYPASASTVSVQYAVAGTATFGADYSLTNGWITFYPYETNRDIPLVILDDGTPESNETVTISLTQTSGNALLGGNRSRVETIVDTDASVLAAPAIVPGGTVGFTNWLQVMITSAVVGADIRYTTDGSLPDSNAKRYSAPVILQKSVTLTARVFLGSYNTGNWSQATFLLQTPAPGVSVYPRWLGVITNGPGTITGGNKWVSSGTNVTIQATPSAFYSFGGWAGDVAGVTTNSATVAVTVTNDRTLTGNFVPVLAVNQTPQSWLAAYYTTNNYDNAALSDTDKDGMKAWEEYQAGTVPTDSNSYFAVTRTASTNGIMISWPSMAGRAYSIQRSTNLSDLWPGPVASNIWSDGSGTTTFSEPPSNSRSFYRVGVHAQ